MSNYTVVAAARLQDVLQLAEHSYATGTKRREILFLVKLFALQAGYSVSAADTLTADVNRRFVKPLPSEQLKAATQSAEKGLTYRNTTLCHLLQLADERTLSLRCIMSHREKRRRKSVRNAKYYAAHRTGDSAKRKIQRRIAEMTRRYLGGTLDRRQFQAQYAIGKTQYYTDLKTAKLWAAKLLLALATTAVKPSKPRRRPRVGRAATRSAYRYRTAHIIRSVTSSLFSASTSYSSYRKRKSNIMRLNL